MNSTNIYKAKTNKTEEKTDFMDITDSSLISSDLSDADSSENLSWDDICVEKDQIDDKLINTDIYDAKINNKTDENTSFMDINDSSLMSSDLSDVVSDNLADSTENLSLEDFCSEINDDINMNDKEDFNKIGKDSKEDIIKSNNAVQASSNVNFNGNIKLLYENADGLGSNSMSNDKHGHLNELQVTKMDFDDYSTNNIPKEISSQPEDEEPNKIEHGVAKVDDNNTDVLTQFIENNIVDFVQRPREFYEILSSLIEFEITPNNICGNFQLGTHSNNNDLKTSNDEYTLMDLDLDAMVDDIESIDAYIDSITNSHTIEDLDAITSQDVDNILNRNSNDSIPPQTNISNDNTVSVNAEKPELQDFELEIDRITNYEFNVHVEVQAISSEKDNSSKDTDSVIIIADSQNNSFVPDKNEEVKQVDDEHAFVDQGSKDTFVNAITSPINNMQMDEETISTEQSNTSSQVTENVMINTDSNNNIHVENENTILKENLIMHVQRGRTTVDQTKKNTFPIATANNVNVTQHHVTTDRNVTQNHVRNNVRKIAANATVIKVNALQNHVTTKSNVTQNNVSRNIKKIAANAQIIDTIIISSDDEEENFPLAILKKKNDNKAKITPNNSDHISISSNESKKTDKDDPNYCSGYESSDFEFITEEEAKKVGITYKKHSKNKAMKPKTTLQIESIDRLSSESDRSVIEYPNEPTTAVSRHNFDYNINQPGPSGLNHNPNTPGPSGINHSKNKLLYNVNYFKNKGLNNTASTEGHEIPVANDYLNLFRGLHERAFMPNYSLENKSVYEPNPSIPGMYIDVNGVGFDLGARQNQPYDDDIDDEARAEARENRNKIMQMYPGDNKKRKRRR